MNAISRHNASSLDNPHFRRGAMAIALANKLAGVKFGGTEEAAAAMENFAYMKPSQIMEACIIAAGIEMPRRVTPDFLVQNALHSTSDFPYVLGDTANKIMLVSYQAAAPTYKAWCAPQTFNDFKPHKMLQSGDFPNLLEVGENGEVTYGTISESKETVTLATYARIFGVNRQALINDDLSMFSQVATMAGRRTAAFENALAYGVLLQSALGPLMSDGLRLYHATHANFQTTGTAVNMLASLTEGRAAMRNQTSLDGMQLNIASKTLVVGSANESAAEQITATLAPTSTSGVNPFAGKLQVVVDSQISDYAWFLFADPAQHPAMIAGSLQGQDAPVITTRPGWDVEGVEFKVLRDFVAGAVDYRPTWRNDGSAPAA